MKVLQSLITGMAGAENGRVELYDRNTSNRAQHFSDFEGSSPSIADITLDANGRAEVYVGNFVRVEVFASDGTTVVANFDDGDLDKAVEVVSPSFTGTPYDGGGDAPNRPTNLNAVLGRWIDSAGSIDWKVDIDGTSTNLDDAFSAVSGLFFNVKFYGATGDGATDDVGGIQAAINAATVAGGGIVFFPSGTYRVTTGITFQPSVSLLGSGAGNTILSRDSVATNTFVRSFPPLPPDGVVPRQGFISGLKIRAQSVSTGPLLELHGQTLDSCEVGSSQSNGQIMATSTGSYLRDCKFIMGNSPSAQVQLEAGANASIVGCTFVVPNSFGDIPDPTLNNCIIRINLNTRVSSCQFLLSNVTAGTFSCIRNVGLFTGPGRNAVTGCSFDSINTASPPTRVVAIFNDSGRMSESGNIFGTGVVPYAFDGAIEAIAFLPGSRPAMWAALDDNSTTVLLSLNVASVFTIRRTSSSNFTVASADTYVIPGQQVSIAVNNTSGSSITVTWGTGLNASSTMSVSANRVRCATFKSISPGAIGTPVWVSVDSSGEDTVELP